MSKNILAVVVAFVVAGLCVFAIEAIGHRVYPLPAGMDTTDMKQIAEYVKTAPAGALLFVLAAQSAGSFVGGLITALLAGSRKYLLALIYGLLALLMASLNLVMVPHPMWMAALSVILPLPLSFLGSKLGQILRPAAAV